MKINYNLIIPFRAFCFWLLSVAEVLLFTSCLLFSTVAMAQCPDDFTNLYSSHVKAFTGSVTNPFLNEGVVEGRHTVIDMQGTDPRTGGVLNLLPPGESKVVKLGNEEAAACAEALVYSYTVDVDNSILLLKFAVVLEEPGHVSSAQPRFIVRITDINGELVEECAEYDVTASAEISGFQTYQHSADIVIIWRDWTTMSIDLAHFIGKQVNVQFITYDCSQGAHYGYCYFTASCMSDRILLGECEDGFFTLIAPDFFKTYLWSNGTTERTAIFSADETNYSQIICTVTTDMNCEVVLFTYINTDLENVIIHEFSDIICEGDSYDLNNFLLPPQPAGEWVYQQAMVDPTNCEMEVITLNLTVVKRYTCFKAAICHGEDYTENGFNILMPAPGVYHDTINTGKIENCDTFTVLELIVNNNFSMPDLIIGNTSPCANELNVYSFLGSETLTSFFWEFSDNIVVVRGKYTPQVTVYFIDDTPGLITLHATNGCGAGTTSLQINPNPSYIIQLNEQVCQGEIFNEYGFNLGKQNTPGYYVYAKHLTTILGCDSIVNLGLNVLPTPALHIEPKDTVLCLPGENLVLWALTGDMHFSNADECSDKDYPFVYVYDCGISYLWTPGGSTAGFITVNPFVTTTYTVTVSTKGGCSISESQTVIVDPQTPIVVYDTICRGETYAAYGLSETETGVYSTTIHSSVCDMDFTVFLTVNELPEFIISRDICVGELFTDYGFYFTLYKEGEFRDTVRFTSSLGCDSLVIFDMFVLPQKTTILYDNVCQYSAYSKNGFSLEQQYLTGVQTYTLNDVTEHGCDSTVILRLFVYPVYKTDFIADIGCEDEVTSFINTSIILDEGNVLNWSWYLDDSTTPFATTRNASKVMSAGYHEVRLELTSIGGCTNSTIYDFTVIDSVTPKFNISPVTYCVNDIPSILPNRSTNLITGNWSPDKISTGIAALGTNTYTFEPNVGNCARKVALDIHVIICKLIDCSVLENRFAEEDEYGAGKYTHIGTNWDASLLLPVDSIQYFLFDNLLSSGATATLNGAQFPVGISKVIVVAYYDDFTDTCDFIVTVERACPTNVFDDEGNEYKVTKLAGLCWTENIKATKYAVNLCDEPIPFAKPYYSTLYADPEENTRIFGLLYDWYSATGTINTDCPTSVPNQGICPEGWRIPTSEEWNRLNQFNVQSLMSENYWLNPGTDDFGFDARPAGWYKGSMQRFEDLYGFTGWWASDDNVANNQFASYFYFAYYCSVISRDNIAKGTGLSVKCVLD
jgi:uncharacterized protein (TIGR02145 family)